MEHLAGPPLQLGSLTLNTLLVLHPNWALILSLCNLLFLLLYWTWYHTGVASIALPHSLYQPGIPASFTTTPDTLCINQYPCFFHNYSTPGVGCALSVVIRISVSFRITGSGWSLWRPSKFAMCCSLNSRSCTWNFSRRATPYSSALEPVVGLFCNCLPHEELCRGQLAPWNCVEQYVRIAKYRFEDSFRRLLTVSIRRGHCPEGSVDCFCTMLETVQIWQTPWRKTAGHCHFGQLWNAMSREHCINNTATTKSGQLENRPQ